MLFRSFAHVRAGASIGAAAVILPDVTIGRWAMIGANTLVTEGKEFPDGSMILGSPARVARQLGDAELTMLKMSSSGYVHNHQRFRDKLKQVG